MCISPFVFELLIPLSVCLSARICVCAAFLSPALSPCLCTCLSMSLTLLIRLHFCLSGSNRSFPVKPLPDHRWNVVKRYKLTPGKLKGVDVGKDHLMDTLVSDLKKDIRDQGFGSQLVSSIASAPMPADNDSASLSVAAITSCFVLSSVVND